jgi:hypothetical protein
MLLIWGRRWYTRHLGFVGEFCEMCRRPQPFRLERRALTGHLWHIPLGQEHAVAHRGTCTACGTAADVDPTRYASYARKPSDARHMLAQTFPNFEQVAHARMETERLVRSDVAALAPQDRQRLIVTPFVLMSCMAEERFRATHFDLGVGIAVLGLFVLPPLAQAAWSAFLPYHAELGLVLGALLALALISWQATMAKRRWVRRMVLPRLGTCLGPLRPTDAELEGVIAELGRHGHQLAKYLRTTRFERPSRAVTAA